MEDHGPGIAANCQQLVRFAHFRSTAIDNTKRGTAFNKVTKVYYTTRKGPAMEETEKMRVPSSWREPSSDFSINVLADTVVRCLN